jgi:8-oxo-dGTP pyrophosphatase MutT (NUDIX family)
MTFLQKIYYNNKPLLLTNQEDLIRNYPNFLVLKGANASNYNEALRVLQLSNTAGVIIIESSKANMEKELLWNFYPIHSAGGIVENELGEILMIYRRGKWDLPKGKQDEGEDLEQCAIREVMEETGLNQVEIVSKISNTYHIYPIGRQNVLKYTSWYKMIAKADASLQAQKEEKIEIVTWVKPQNIPALLEHSFETIKDILEEAKII